jgi:3-oxoadipate enol-lactonase
MLRVRGFDLHHEVSGEGRDLIWGHGLTSSIESENALGIIEFDRLARSTRLVRYDARGSGQSESTESSDDYRWKALALDQLALADELGIESYVAGGASMGTATAIHAAVMAPERIRALVLTLPPTAWQTRAEQVAGYVIAADLVETGQIATMVAASRARPLPDPFVDDVAWRERFEQTMTNEAPERLARLYRGAAIADLPSQDDVAAISVPTLILAWTGDPGHPVSSALQLEELIAGCELALASTKTELAGWTGRIERFLAAIPD